MHIPWGSFQTIVVDLSQYYNSIISIIIKYFTSQIMIKIDIADYLNTNPPFVAYFQNMDADWNTALGTHGYDNRLMSMKPIFMARGPDIKVHHEIQPFMSLDIYPLTAKLLDIVPAPNNGTLDIVHDMIRDYDNEPRSVAVKSSASLVTVTVFSLSLWSIPAIMVVSKQ